MRVTFVIRLFAALGVLPPLAAARAADDAPAPPPPAQTLDVVRPQPPTLPAPDGVNVKSSPVGRTHDCSAYYPRASKILGQTGQVFLTYDVGADGVIANVTLVKSSGHDLLDAQALACVREAWRNTIALADGKPVPSLDHKAAIGFWLDPGQTADYFYQQGLAQAFTAGGEAGLHNAILSFGKAIAMAPDDNDAYYQRGLAYQRLGDRPNAEADFAKSGKPPPAATPGPALAH